MNEFISQELENIEVKEGFKIENLESSLWAFKKLRALTEKRKEIEEVAQKEIDTINNWKENQLEGIKAHEEYFQGLIMEYYIKEKAKDKKFKLNTPYGKVSSRKTKKWTYTNEEELSKYLNDNYGGLGVTVKTSLDKKIIKKEFKNGISADGEVLPYIDIEEVENITVKVGE